MAQIIWLAKETDPAWIIGDEGHYVSQPQIKRKKDLDAFQKTTKSNSIKRRIYWGATKIKKSRKFFLLKSNYLVVTLSAILLINVTQFFDSTELGGIWFKYSISCCSHLFGGYFNPLDYASDINKYIRQRKLDKVYLDLQRILTQLLVLSDNLHKDNKSSLSTYNYFYWIAETISAILFYNSGFAILGVPFLMMFVIQYRLWKNYQLLGL